MKRKPSIKHVKKKKKKIVITFISIELKDLTNFLLIHPCSVWGIITVTVYNVLVLILITEKLELYKN